MKIFNRKINIIADGHMVKGTVTATKTLYWLTVNKSAFRVNNAESLHPHIIYFKYSVNGTEYRGKRYMSWAVPEFHVGQQLNVYINKENPKEYTLNY